MGMWVIPWGMSEVESELSKEKNITMCVNSWSPLSLSFVQSFSLLPTPPLTPSLTEECEFLQFQEKSSSWVKKSGYRKRMML